MTLPRRKQSGGIVLMALVIITMIAMVFGLAWYAFNGGKRAEATPTPAETVIPID
jgi:flagellar basal body-associated protein FliL